MKTMRYFLMFSKDIYFQIEVNNFKKRYNVQITYKAYQKITYGRFKDTHIPFLNAKKKVKWV